MSGKKRNRLTMDELVANTKQVLKGKLPQSNNRDSFDNVLKKAVAIKQRGSK